MKRYFVILVLFVSLFSLALLGPSLSKAGEKELRVGALFAFSGPLAYTGENCMMGLDILADYYNQRGGINGRKIVFFKGDAHTTEAAMSEAERLIRREKVDLIIGTYLSSRAMTGSQVAERKKVFYWETGAASDKLLERGFKYFFKTTPSTSNYGGIAAVYAAREALPKLGLKPAEAKVVCMHEGSLFGTTLAQNFMKQAEKEGMKIAKEIKYNYKDRDFSSTIMVLKEMNPDVLYDAAYMTDFVVFWNQCKEFGYSPPVLLGGGTFSDPGLPEALGNGVNGLMPCYSILADAKMDKLLPRSRELYDVYLKGMKSKYNIDHTSAASSAILTFDAGQILFEYIIPKVKDPGNAEELRKACLALDLAEGVSLQGFGVKFMENGENEKAWSAVMQWQNEKLKVVYPEKWATADPIIPMPTWEQRK